MDNTTLGAAIALCKRNTPAPVPPTPTYDYETPQDYGAYGDGVHDDYAAIQAAIEANKGKTILIPNGTYLISETLKTYPSNENYTDIIMDDEAVIIPSAPMNYVIELGGISETFTETLGGRIKLLQGGTIDGSNGNVLVGVLHMAPPAVEIFVKDLEIKANACYGIVLGTTDATRKSGNHIFENINIFFTTDNVNNEGIYNGENDCTFQNILINNCARGIIHYGGSTYYNSVRVYCKTTTISNNIIADLRQGAAFFHNLAVKNPHKIFYYPGDSGCSTVVSNSRLYCDNVNNVDCILIDLSVLTRARYPGMFFSCVQWRPNNGTNSKAYGIKIPYNKISALPSDVIKGDILIYDANKLVQGDPLYSLRYNPEYQISYNYEITSTRVNKWLNLGTFICTQNSTETFTVNIDGTDIVIPVSVSCDSSGNLTTKITGKLNANGKQGTYYIGFALLNPGFDPDVDVARVMVMFKMTVLNEYLNKAYMSWAPLYFTPLEQHTAIFIDPQPSNVLNYKIDCDNETITLET